MKASFENPTKKNNFASNRKENKFFCEYALIDLDAPQYNKTPVLVRFYFTPSTTYCCIWVRFGNNHYEQIGSDKALGYGLDRKLSAIEKAFKDAGIIFDKGVNDIHKTLEAVAELLEVKTYYIHHAHA